jgi:anti-sigma regulatory factor (Ser/Thr protein kinase)
MTSRHFELDVAAGACGLADVRGEVRQCLRSRGLDAAVVDEAVLALGEALNNAIEHSGPIQPAPVDISVRLVDDELSIVVSDHGRWRDRPSRPDGGRGLGIMRAVMDSVSIDADSAGTRVHLRKHLTRRTRVPQGAPFGV